VPHFRVMLHGTGIEVPGLDGDGPPIVGFYTSRNVTTADVDGAVEAATAIIRAEWTTGDYASASRGSAPVLTAEGVFSISALKRWFTRVQGYTFYADDDEGEPENPPPNTSLERTREG
jgi:hypothetical protein